LPCQRQKLITVRQFVDHVLAKQQQLLSNII
jgi:hypothetical protein